MGKASYRFRHANFCQKCLSNNYIDKDEQQDIDSILKCRKCTKIKFRGRHAVFCDAKCPSYFSSSSSSTTPSTTTTTEAHEEENEIVSYENLTKDERRKLKLERRMERRRERTRRRLEKARRKSGEQDESQEEEYKLGPLGNFIKELIVANTFVD